MDENTIYLGRRLDANTIQLGAHLSGQGRVEPGQRGPDFNADFSQDFRAALPDDDNEG